MPINISFVDNVVVPIPPLEIVYVPNDTLEAFKIVIAEPEPTKLDADKVFDVLSHVNFADCKMDGVVFPINIWFVDNVVVPIPPLDIDNVPNDTWEARKEVNCRESSPLIPPRA